MARHIGPYLLVRELGRGGMGVVHEVRDAAGRRLALKLILDAGQGEALTRFRREAELMARVTHPNVVRVHALDVAPEGPFIVTELVDGRSLSQVAREGPLAPAAAAQLVRTLADAVEALHARGILHRDLKPQNVIVRPDDTPVLLDFGLARDVVSKERLTVTGALMGTPVYMAPEQAEGARPSSLGPTVDVYALGAVLLETLSGLPPFDETQGAMVTIKRVIMDEPRWPSSIRPGVPHALEAICRLAMSKAPADRYASAAALRDDLDRFLRGEPPQALARFPAPRSGAGLALAVGCAALAFALGTAALVLHVATPAAPPGTATAAPAPDAPVPVARPPAPAPAPAPAAPATPASLEGGLVLAHAPGAGAVNGAFVDARTVVTWGREDGDVRVWSVEREVRLLRQATLPGRALEAALHDGALLVRTPTEVLRVDLADLRLARRFSLPGELPVRHYEDRRPLAVTGDAVFVPTERALHVLDARTLEPREGPPLELPDDERDRRFASAAARGRWVVAGSGQSGMSAEERRTRLFGEDRDPDELAGHGELHLWDLTTGRRRFVRGALPSTVIAVALDRSEPPRIAFGLYSGVLGVWSGDEDAPPERLAGSAVITPTASETAELTQWTERLAHSGHIYGLAFARDGRLFSSSCGYTVDDRMNEVRVWSPDGAQLGRLIQLRRGARALELSPDDDRLLVGVWTIFDGWTGAELWEVKTLEARLRRD
jgi:predicted Ser/Thr protein kinase